MEYPEAGVYFSGQDFNREAPAFMVERALARRWLKEGKAWSVHHGRDIALVPEVEPSELEGAAEAIPERFLKPEESCVMGEVVMNANAAEERWAQHLVRAWNPRVAQIQHVRSLRKFAKRGNQQELRTVVAVDEP